MRACSEPDQGQPGRLTVAAWPDESFAGAVDLIDPVVDVATRTVEIRLLADNPNQRLLPGMFARVQVVVESRSNAVVIPEAALVPSMDGFGVYAVQDGVARLRSIQLGVRLPGRAEIRNGLQGNSQFVASGTQKIVDGMKVVSASPDTNVPAATD